VRRSLAIAIALLLVLSCCVRPREDGPNPHLYGGNYPHPTVDPDNTASTEVVTRFLEPAPPGYAWEYVRDWDGSIDSKCLVNAREDEGNIDIAIHQHLRSHQPPQGYWWTGEGKSSPTGGPNIVVRVCVRRLACTYGKEPNSEECITP
jgi:hypothetical protein